MQNADGTHTYFSVVAGLSEAVNFATVYEALSFAKAQRELGLFVRVWAMADGHEPLAISSTEGS